MADSGLSPEDEEALRLMREERGGYDGDLRAEDDPDWLANGAQVELFGLQSEKAMFLNGQTGEVIGFDNQHRRYRVRLHSDETVKVVHKKNIRVLFAEETAAEAAAPQAPAPPAGSVRLGPPSPSRGQLQTVGPTAAVELVPTVGSVRRSIDKVSHAARVLNQHCEMRRNGVAGNAMSDAFLALSVAMDTYTEVIDMYETAYGASENASGDMRRLGDAAIHAAEERIEDYQTLRTWAELATDELNLTRYSIRKHGVVGTLKNEFVEVGRDVAEIGGGAATLARSGAGHVPHMVRSATGSIGGAVQQGSEVAVTATSGIIARSRTRASQALEDQLFGPVKRTWHLVLTAFLICYLVPLFGLRTYAPLNSVVGNLGLVYGGVCIVCPPRCARSRRAKGAMLILWPLFMVVLPLALHYWLTHPPVPPGPAERGGRVGPQWQVTQMWERMSGPSQDGGGREAESPSDDRGGWVPQLWDRMSGTSQDDSGLKGEPTPDDRGRWAGLGRRAEGLEKQEKPEKVEKQAEKPEKPSQRAWLGPAGPRLRNDPLAVAPGVFGGAAAPLWRLLRSLAPRTGGGHRWQRASALRGQRRRVQRHDRVEPGRTEV